MASEILLPGSAWTEVAPIGFGSYAFKPPRNVRVEAAAAPPAANVLNVGIVVGPRGMEEEPHVASHSNPAFALYMRPLDDKSMTLPSFG